MWLLNFFLSFGSFARNKKTHMVWSVSAGTRSVSLSGTSHNLIKPCDTIMPGQTRLFRPLGALVCPFEPRSGMLLFQQQTKKPIQWAGASAGTRTQNNGSVDRRDIHFTTNADCKFFWFLRCYYSSPNGKCKGILQIGIEKTSGL